MTYYVVSHRDGRDDDFFKYSSITMLGRTRQEAWLRFLLLTGKDRRHFNKLGFIAVPVKVSVEFM
jgi:hypothetical protein